MIFDFIEVIIALLCFLLIRKKFFQYLINTKKALKLTIIFATIYVLAIHAIGFTEIGNETFKSFTTGSIIASSVWFLVIYVIFMVISEELIFRVYLYEKINVFISALVFSGIHWRPNDFPNLMFLILFVFGLLQSLLFYKTKNFLAICIAHLVALITLVIIYG